MTPRTRLMAAAVTTVVMLAAAVAAVVFAQDYFRGRRRAELLVLDAVYLGHAAAARNQTNQDNNCKTLKHRHSLPSFDC